MKKQTISGWEMCLRMQNFLSSNSTIVALIVGGTEAQTAISARISAIADLKKSRSQAEDGSADAKMKAKAELIGTATEGVHVLRAWATVSKDETLKGKMKKLLRKVKRSGGSGLITESQGVYDLIQSNLTALLPWELDAATQTSFLNKINAYSNLLSKPQQATATRSRIGADVENLVKELIAEFKDLDALVFPLEKKHPDFVKEYILNRQLIDKPTIKRAAMLKVLDEETKAPIGKVKMVTPFGVYTSTTKGNLVIPSASEGSCSVKLVKPGMQDAEYTLVIVAGETNKQTFYLKAA